MNNPDSIDCLPSSQAISICSTDDVRDKEEIDNRVSAFFVGSIEPILRSLAEGKTPPSNPKPSEVAMHQLQDYYERRKAVKNAQSQIIV